MYRRYLILLLTLTAIAIAIFVAIWGPRPPADNSLRPTDPALVAQGQTIYADACASCHGKTLQGQPNWRDRDADGYLPTPPHDENGHTWHHSDKHLLEITKHGLAALANRDYKTRMPTYKRVLTDQEIVAVLSYIKSRWPKEIQARHDKINESAKQR